LASGGGGVRRRTVLEEAMAVTSIEDLFVNELRDIYSAEKQLTRALPRMAKAAKHPDLREAFESHLEETRGQIERLDQVFEQLDLPKRAKKCEAMEGLIEEAREHMEELDDKALLDVGMIISAQKVEHYEIAGYGSLVALAKQLGHDEAAGLLAETLDEEKAADQKLNKIAASVNAEAAQSSESEAQPARSTRGRKAGGRSAG
jgi:ferritin-like metal-binding protein YciE